MTSLFLLSFLLSFIVLLIVIFLSHKYEYFIDCGVTEKPQKFHTVAVSRGGGIGIFIAMGLVLLIPFGIYLFPALILTFLSGIFEDFHNSLSPRLRLALQVIAAILAIWFTDSVVTYLGLGIELPYWLGVIFSIFAIVGMINAINIIDGFNGLASGVVLLILGSFAVVTFEHHNMELSHVIMVSAGATFGLFVLVFPKGKIFLGDGGAYLLGLVVALIGIHLAGTYENVSPWYVLAVFIYPAWEVIFSIIRKLSIGLSPIQPDKYHMHMLVHRQLTNNNPLTALIIMFAVSPFMIFSTIYAHSSKYNMVVSLVFVLFYLVSYRYLYKRDTLQTSV